MNGYGQQGRCTSHPSWTSWMIIAHLTCLWWHWLATATKQACITAQLEYRIIKTVSTRTWRCSGMYVLLTFKHSYPDNQLCEITIPSHERCCASYYCMIYKIWFKRWAAFYAVVRMQRLHRKHDCIESSISTKSVGISTKSVGQLWQMAFCHLIQADALDY